MRERIGARMQERLQLMHDALGPRGDQEGAWTAFLAEMRPPAGARPMEPARDDEPGSAAPVTTPERLERMAARMNERDAAFQRHAQAIRTSYWALDGRQRRTFERSCLS